MTDNKSGHRVSSARKLKTCSAPVNDDLNGGVDEKRSSKKAKKTGNENVLLLYPNSACSPEESVFSIDHILESIFAELGREALLNCRLVSRRWLYFSSNTLQKTITLKLEHDYKDANASNQQVLLCNGEKERPIKDLVTLMNNSTNFPCRSFLLNNYCEESDSLAQRFFNSHGTFITKLVFEGYLRLTDLKRLLLSQAPNLEQLVLNCVTFRWTESETRFNKTDMTNEGRLRRESLFNKTTIGLSKPALNNLKVFICDATIPTIFLQQLLDCSPNLVEVFVDLKFIHYLVQPINRLNLLKKLEVEIEIKNIQLIKDLANKDHYDNWAVREIQFLNYDVYRDRDLASQAAEALSKILKGCSKTCQTLLWNDHLEYCQIPPMPGVRHLRFQYSEDPETELPVHLLEGVSLEDTFPNLTFLEIVSYCDMENLLVKNIFGNDDPLPLPGVKKVSLDFHAGPTLLESIRKMFPNASVTERRKQKLVKNVKMKRLCVA